MFKSQSVSECVLVGRNTDPGDPVTIQHEALRDNLISPDSEH